MTLADRIAEYLAGTGRPITSDQIAEDLGEKLSDVYEVLFHDGRFTVESTWRRVLEEPEDRHDAGDKSRSVSSYRAGSSPAPRADASLVEVARHDPFRVLHSLHWRHYAVQLVVKEAA